MTNLRRNICASVGILFESSPSEHPQQNMGYPNRGIPYFIARLGSNIGKKWMQSKPAAAVGIIKKDKFEHYISHRDAWWCFSYLMIPAPHNKYRRADPSHCCRRRQSSRAADDTPDTALHTVLHSSDLGRRTVRWVVRICLPLR